MSSGFCGASVGFRWRALCGDRAARARVAVGARPRPKSSALARRRSLPFTTPEPHPTPPPQCGTPSTFHWRQRQPQPANVGGSGAAGGHTGHGGSRPSCAGRVDVPLGRPRCAAPSRCPRFRGRHPACRRLCVGRPRARPFVRHSGPSAPCAPRAVAGGRGWLVQGSRLVCWGCGVWWGRAPPAAALACQPRPPRLSPMASPLAHPPAAPTAPLVPPHPPGPTPC